MIALIRDSLQRRPGRRLSDPEFSKLPKAAVGMILKPDQTRKELDLLLLKRRISESDPWSGHMAFPGGRMHEGDRELINTAYREVMEETSIDPKTFEPLGTLDELTPGNRSLTVVPYVFVAPESTKVIIDRQEISDFVWIPINFFANKKNSAPLTVKALGKIWEVNSFTYVGTHIVWGMTLRVIEDFLSKIQ